MIFMISSAATWMDWTNTPGNRARACCRDGGRRCSALRQQLSGSDSGGGLDAGINREIIVVSDTRDALVELTAPIPIPMYASSKIHRRTDLGWPYVLVWRIFAGMPLPSCWTTAPMTWRSWCVSAPMLKPGV